MKKYILYCILTACCLQTIAQTSKSVVEGRVLDLSTGQGLVGVTVHNSSIQVITDADGAYRIPGRKGVTQLTFTYEGFTPRQLLVPVSADSVHVEDIYLSDIVLSPIDAQYKAYTENADLSPDEAIADHLAHDVRSIRRSGQYGIGNMMFIRGLGTLNTSASPLIVIDGAVVEDFPGEKSIHSGFFTNRLLDVLIVCQRLLRDRLVVALYLPVVHGNILAHSVLLRPIQAIVESYSEPAEKFALLTEHWHPDSKGLLRSNCLIANLPRFRF